MPGPRSPVIRPLRSRWRAVLAVAPLAVAALAPGAFAAEGQASAGLKKLLGEVAAWDEEPPRLPVPPGVDPRYKKRLEDVSEGRWGRERETFAGFAERLRAIDRQALGPSERLDAAILERRLRDHLEELRFRAFEMPIGSREGFHMAVAVLPDTHSFETVEQWDEYVAKLQSFREHTAQRIAALRAGLLSGRTLPREVLAGYEETIAPQVVDDPARSDLARPFERIPAAFPEADRERLRRDGMAAVRDSAVPGFRDFLAFMKDEYIPRARPTLGLAALPDGEAFYRHRIRMHTTLDLSPRQVHDMGRREVARLRREMEATARRAGFEGSFAEFVEHLRTDPRFQAGSSEEYLQAVALWAKRMDGALPRLFGRLPRTPYGIRAMSPRVAPRMSAGFYSRGEADGSKAGQVNINTSDIKARPLYVAPVLAFHEGVPGHHLQIMLARENEALSPFRKKLGITVFGEGWGLYAEQLGAEAGLELDPYQDFGRLTYEIWRAVRLVVDSGVHALGWSRPQAIDYMAENTGFQRGPSTAEVDRHITEAGQGLAYTPGLLKIRELRARAEARLGPAFDVRAFHDAVLAQGALPLDLLEQQVEAWLASVERK